MDSIQSAVDYAGTLGAVIQNFSSAGFTATFPTENAVDSFIELVEDDKVNVTVVDEVTIIVSSSSTNAL